jgi:hypothetical protein
MHLAQFWTQTGMGLECGWARWPQWRVQDACMHARHDLHEQGSRRARRPRAGIACRPPLPNGHLGKRGTSARQDQTGPDRVQLGHNLGAEPSLELCNSLIRVRRRSQEQPLQARTPRIENAVRATSACEWKWISQFSAGWGVVSVCSLVVATNQTWLGRLGRYLATAFVEISSIAGEGFVIVVDSQTVRDLPS